MVAASQSVVPHAQLAGLAAVPSVVAQATKELHELNEDVQKSPVVAASQSVVPHAQVAGLAAVPFVVAQATKELHELSEDVQKSPVPDQQSTEPHLQTPSFSEAPLPSEQAAGETRGGLQSRTKAASARLHVYAKNQQEKGRAARR